MVHVLHIVILPHAIVTIYGNIIIMSVYYTGTYGEIKGLRIYQRCAVNV